MGEMVMIVMYAARATLGAAMDQHADEDLRAGCGFLLFSVPAVLIVIGAWSYHPLLGVGTVAALLGLGVWWFGKKSAKEARDGRAARQELARWTRARSWRPGSGALAGDADRDIAVEILRLGHEDGRLTLEELQERLDRAVVARTHGQLADALRGLLP